MPPTSKQNSNASLGRALIRDRRDKNRAHLNISRDKEPSAESARNYILHTTEMNDGAAWSKYNSVTEQRDLDDFLTTAQLADKEFTAERRNVQVVSMDINENANSPAIISAAREQQLQQLMEANKDFLRIPRRPKWTPDTPAEVLQKNERDSFLEWRRNLASLQDKEDLVITPFERNLEVWRQLWRVIEKSDVIVQIVDARNPLLFRCTDLEEYVLEINPNKKNLLLINKSDLLRDDQRQEWAKYFRNNGINYVFWSARMGEKELAEEQLKAQELKDQELLRQAQEKFRLEEDEEDDHFYSRKGKHVQTRVEDEEDDDDEEEEEEYDSDNEHKEDMDLSNQKEGDAEDETTQGNDKTNDDNDGIDIKIYSRKELLELFLTYCPPLEKDDDGNITRRPTVGFVGYPNVGKSSTINVLFASKKVAVAATPGKTKHFQTLIMENGICLCDCPGLVFPNFTSTKADMVCNGILPVDQMRDAVEPAALVCHRIPRQILEIIYGISLPQPAEGEDSKRPPTAHELLSAYAYNRSFMKSGHGLPDEQRAGRIILKDYVNGKLLYCTPPPGIKGRPFNMPTYKAQYKSYFQLKHRKAAAVELEAEASSSGAIFDPTEVDMRRLNVHASVPGRSLAGPRHHMKYVNDVDAEFFKQTKVVAKQKGRSAEEILRSGGSVVGDDAGKKHIKQKRRKDRTHRA